MRGDKRIETQLKLDRTRVTSFYISADEKKLYDADEFKYIIHVLKMYPSDPFHILQYLMLRFHPMIIGTCKKYLEKQIAMDWLDLLSFARYSFVELVMRFNLDSTLFFKKYIPMALDRALNDYHIYDIRRRDLVHAIQLDALPAHEQDAVLAAQDDLLNQDNTESNYNQNELAMFREEVLRYLETAPELKPLDRQIFRSHFLDGLKVQEVAARLGLTTDKVKSHLHEALELVREHIRQNFA